MKILLLLLGLSFFFIFFLFSGIDVKNGLFSSLFLEAQIYFFIAVLSVLGITWLPSFRFHDPSEKESRWLSKYYVSRKDFLSYLKTFFWQYVYYIGISLFYISLFLLLQVFIWSIDIPLIFLCFNILVFFLYFFQNKFPLFQDFIRVNTLIISLFYIFKSIQYTLWYTWWFHMVDLINIAWVFVLFYLFISSSKEKYYISTITNYAFVFFFLQFCNVYVYVFSNSLFWITFLSFFFASVCLILTSPIAKTFSASLSQVRGWGLSLSYIFLLLNVYYFYIDGIQPFMFLLASWITGIILFMFHDRFENYVALSFASLAVSFSFSSLYFYVIPKSLEFPMLFTLFFILSIFFLVGNKFSKNIHHYDKYFSRLFSIGVNIIWVICFFFFVDVTILKISFLLFWECIYFFYGYYNFRSSSQ